MKKLIALGTPSRYSPSRTLRYPSSGGGTERGACGPAEESGSAGRSLSAPPAGDRPRPGDWHRLLRRRSVLRPPLGSAR